MPKIGEAIEKLHVKSGTPPVVFQLQPTGYVAVSKPEELEHWEKDVKSLYGITLSHKGVHACETCSCCQSDDCGLL